MSRVPPDNGGTPAKGQSEQQGQSQAIQCGRVLTDRNTVHCRVLVAIVVILTFNNAEDAQARFRPDRTAQLGQRLAMMTCMLQSTLPQFISCPCAWCSLWDAECRRNQCRNSLWGRNQSRLQPDCCSPSLVDFSLATCPLFTCPSLSCPVIPEEPDGDGRADIRKGRRVVSDFEDRNGESKSSQRLDSRSSDGQPP